MVAALRGELAESRAALARAQEDLPEAAVAVTEHQLIERECGCGQRTRAAAPPKHGIGFFDALVMLTKCEPWMPAST